MTKFEEEFNNNVEIFDVIGNHNSMCCEVDQVKEVFKDWQPQQALPVVPDYVGNAVMKINLEHLFTGYTNGINEKAKNWLERHKGVKSLGYYVCQLRFQGFKVEKPQLFYLKNKITGAYLYYDEATKLYSDIVGNVEDFFGIKTKFTQQEIDSMQTGSYELVPVEDGE